MAAVGQRSGRKGQENPSQAQAFDGLDGWDLSEWNEDRLHDFIGRQTLAYGEESKKALEYLRFFAKHRKLRRPEIWQS